MGKHLLAQQDMRGPGGEWDTLCPSTLLALPTSTPGAAPPPPSVLWPYSSRFDHSSSRGSTSRGGGNGRGRDLGPLWARPCACRGSVCPTPAAPCLDQSPSASTSRWPRACSLLSAAHAWMETTAFVRVLQRSRTNRRYIYMLHIILYNIFYIIQNILCYNNIFYITYIIIHYYIIYNIDT